MVALDLRAAPEQREESAVVVEAADLWLLFALLAMRDGRFNEALERYTELRRQTPVLLLDRIKQVLLRGAEPKTAKGWC
jgi:hypothetical protein